MKRMVVIVTLSLSMFVAPTASAAGPNGGQVRGYIQRSAAGWQQAGRSAVAAGHWAANHVRIGDQAFIGNAIQGATNKAQGKH